jgi:hypothetical protein
LTITLFADQNSAANGMKFEFSTDNTNWDINVASGFDYLASTGRIFQFTVQARYFRVRFTNGASAQGALRIQTLLHRDAISLPSIHRLDADVKPDRSATLVKAGLLAQVNGAGDFVPIQANAAGILKVGGSIDIDTLPAIPAGTNNIGDVDVLTLPTITEPKSTTATTSQVADNSASVTILASNASRLGATILNDSSAALYLRLGSSAATTTNYTVRITQYGYYEVPFRYTGAITGIWASDPGDGAARVTELT